MDTIELRGSKGIRLVANVDGDPTSPPVLLFHGGGQTRWAWGTTLGALAAKGWHAYSVDMRGHGDSDWAPDGDYSVDAFADDVRTIARSMPSPPVLVGASLGGTSALTAVGETPPPPLATALVLVDVAPRVERAGADRIAAFMQEHMTDGFGSLEEVADAISAYNPHRPRPSDLSGLRKNLRERDGRWYWHWDPRFLSIRTGSDETRMLRRDPARLERAARAITIPTLIVRGRQSDVLSEEGARSTLELIPHAELVDVEGAGHMVAGDKNDLFNDAVVAFLESVRPS